MATCGKFLSHRFKTYGTDHSVLSCVRCGKPWNARQGNVEDLIEDSEQTVDLATLQLMLQSTWACGYQAGRDAADDRRQIIVSLSYKSGRPCDTCGGTGWLDPEHPDYDAASARREQE